MELQASGKSYKSRTPIKENKRRVTLTNQIMETSEEIGNHLWPKEIAEEQKE